MTDNAFDRIFSYNLGLLFTILIILFIAKYFCLMSREKFTEKVCDMDCGKLRSPWKNKTSEVCHCVDNRCIELNCESGFRPKFKSGECTCVPTVGQLSVSSFEKPPQIICGMASTLYLFISAAHIPTVPGLFFIETFFI